MLTLTDDLETLNIDYTKGDTFELEITADEVEPGSSARLQISTTGDTDTIIFEKLYYCSDAGCIIVMDDDDINKLKLGVYEYRISFITPTGKISTAMNGRLNVKWGA